MQLLRLRRRDLVGAATHFHRSYILFQRALITPSSNPPYPALLKPAALLLHTRLINAAIQAFSQLFVYTGSGNRGRMIEIVLENMSKSAAGTK